MISRFLNKVTGGSNLSGSCVFGLFDQQIEMAFCFCLGVLVENDSKHPANFMTAFYHANVAALETQGGRTSHTASHGPVPVQSVGDHGGLY